MKSCDEMVSSLLERREKYNNEQKARRKNIFIISSVLCCAVAAISVFAFEKSEKIIKPPQAEPYSSVSESSNNNQNPYSARNTEESRAAEASEKADTVKEEKSAPDSEKKENEKYKTDTTEKLNATAPQKEKTTDAVRGKKIETAGNAAVGETAILRWKNKLNVNGALCHEMENNPDKVFSVKAVYRPATANIKDFTYKGKTLSEWAIEADNERQVPDKMYELLKWGDSLKYGEALYQTGTPSGEIWDKRLYEDKVAYFGEELLNKYIVNGTFLRDKLEKDIASYSQNSARKGYEEAFNAYMDTVLSSAEKRLTAKNIRFKRSGNSIIVYVTPKELENIPLDDINSWYFYFDIAQ